MALTMVMHMSFYGARMDVALFALQLGASAATVGLLTALFGLLPVLLSVSIGRWADRIGPRFPIQAGASIIIAGLMVGFAFGSLPALFVVSLVVGIAYNLFFVAHQQLVGRVGRPEELATNLSLSSMTFSLSGFISPVITGYAIDRLGAANTFLFLALFAAAGLVVVRFNRRVFPDTRFAAKHADATAAARPRGRVMDLLRQPELRRVYVVAVLSQSTWDAFTVLMPIYGTERGFSASSIGILIGVFSLSTLGIRLLLPAISRRLKPWQLLLVSLLGSSISFFGFPLATGMGPLLALSIWLGIAVGVAAPMLLALIHHASPPDRVGEAVGLRVTMMNGSQTLIPLASGTVVTAIGITSMFWMLGLGLVSGWWFNRDRWRPAPER